MEKKLRLSRLIDLYGAFLTQKQSEVLYQHNELDYSLSEIADNLSITRQAVHFALKGGIDTLENCEKKLSFCDKLDTVSELINKGLSSADLTEKDNALKQTLLILGRE